MDEMHSCKGLETDALLAYAYGECEPAQHRQVAAHVASCAECAAAVESLRVLHGALEAWDAPSLPAGIRVVSEREALGQPWWSQALRPAWGVALAAGVVLGVGLALGGVELQRVDGGFALHVGGAAQPGAAAALQRAEARSGAEPVATPTGGALPWHVDLARLESELRRDLAPEGGHAALLEQVRGLISQSERRQQQQRSLWLTEFAQDLDIQRPADRVPIEDARTPIEVRQH